MTISHSHDARLVATKRRYTSVATAFQDGAGFRRGPLGLHSQCERPGA
jgi:hypothetical protein